MMTIRALGLNLVLAAGLSSSGAIHAISLLNLSTGVAADGTLIPYSTESLTNPDDQWRLVSDPSNPTLDAQATVVFGRTGSDWWSPPDARWISASREAGDGDADHGVYGFEFTFDLTVQAGFLYSIAGDYAADNRLLDVYLNGLPVFEGAFKLGSGCPATGCVDFLTPSPFLIDAQAAFLNGANRLLFVVNNDPPTEGNPMGLIVRASLDRTAVVPLPPTLWLFASALPGIGLLGQRRRRKLAA